MPLGVEHAARGMRWASGATVILALMPLGVEHVLKSADAIGWKDVILALIPLGVEHIGKWVERRRGVAGDPRIDAVRR